MKAIVYRDYGKADLLCMEDIPLPALAVNEALVRVRAAALNPKDSFFRKGRFHAFSGRRFPKQIGVDFVGEIVRVGARFRVARVGEPVMGFVSEVRYLRGTLAEFVRVRENEAGPIPPSFATPDLAGVPLSALTALQALRDVARLAPGDRVCIHGASGGVGTMAIQIAKAMGAHVTTTSSPKNFALCRELGADVPCDYAADDLFEGNTNYRVVFDAFGNLSLAKVRAVLSSRGVYVSTVPSRRLACEVLATTVGFPRARLVVVRPRVADFAYVAELLISGRLRPVTDRTYAFTRTDVIAAMHHLESKRTRGKVIVDMLEHGPFAS
ncbi:NAD(P)-dependent alcohol dehydrogenase [Pendulispora rubella]|uniref:NAD(P)-dependent alcohol dehydrogenase n=1 Tax=Pendulispora rubella TaxID=2741070 RepID=A0ABZ2KVQ8_9BACT